ncbi:MAG: alkyl sulfatase dimerization domain-containing protein [Candidatus Binatia bacterium]
MSAFVRCCVPALESFARPRTGCIGSFARRAARVALIASVVGGHAGCGGETAKPDGAAPASTVAPRVGDQAHQFPRGVIQVTDGVYVAVGYGLANSVLLVGDGAVVIVDTMESAQAAAPVREEFRRITAAPVAAIVYTHNHADHIFGAGVLAGEDRPEVYAHATFQGELDRIVTATSPITYQRSMRQFGTLLPESERTHCGIGPRLVSDATTTASLLIPTRTFDGDRLEVTIAGIRMVMLHLPGETPDQVAVWLPDKRVLVCGDNYYHSFPNLYAIRGTPTRDVLPWVASLDAMRALGAAFLVPGHTLPVTGESEIHSRLTDYRDAIQFVHDQTLRAMNEGRLPDEIVESVKLPKSLAARPWLAEHYGRVDWSVRGIFAGYLGWFGGDAADLSPLTRKARAQNFARVAGGSEKLRDEARAALERGDARWALEVAGHLAALGEFQSDASRVRAAALRSLAAAETSANGRNYYLTQSMEAEGKLVVEPPDPARMPTELLEKIPVGNFLRAMTVRLDATKAEGKSMTVALRFTDVGEEWGMRLRNSIVELEPRLPDRPDMTVTTTSQTWKEVVTGRRNATMAFASGAVKIDRNRLELVRFLFLFRG